jgi:hypothetical protein
MQKPRREFLKITAASAAGLAIARADRAMAAWPGTGTLAVNPNISNLRVVACVDTKMMKSTPANMTFALENAAVDSARLQANMDAMAMQLANQTTADAAWKAIFRSSKAWAATKVAIKVNAIESKNMPRVAVIQKFCTVLAGFGVLPANIIIYDGQATYNGGASNYVSYFSATDTSKTPGAVSTNNSLLGGTTSAPIPGGSSANCTADIANGVIDILIDIATNKGHDLMGRATLSMKNHFGTFAPKHDINYLFNINKSDAILGGNPVRQQLCFIDSLFANKSSNMGVPDAMPCYLVMGVFAPAVDYLTIKKVREGVSGWTHDEATIDSYMTTFGYATTDPVWVLVPPADGTTNADAGAGTGGASGSGGAAGGGGAGGGTSGSGGANGLGGAGSGGTSGSTSARAGGTSASGGARTGGNSGSGGAGTGGTNDSGGAGSGANPGGAGSGGVAATGGAGTGGSNGSGSGGVAATGGAAGKGSSSSGGAAATGGTGTGLATGGSIATGGTSARSSTTASPTGGSAGTGTTGTTATGSSGGCNVAGRGATGLGAAVTLSVVVAEKIRRLLKSDDQ